MQDHYNTRNKELTYSERQCIERWHNKDKLSNHHIAQLLGKAPQTSNNEQKLGLIQLKFRTRYSSKRAQEQHETNKKQCGRHSKVSAKLNQAITNAVRDKQSLGVVPQGFLGVVCLKTLYKWIKNGCLVVKYHELLYPLF